MLAAPARGMLAAPARGTLAALARLSLALPTMAASPTATAGVGGDPRSSGQGPGLVGDPLLAVLAVAAIGLAAVGLTLLYVRMTGRPGA
jgi:hypothetical protein